MPTNILFLHQLTPPPNQLDFNMSTLPVIFVVYIGVTHHHHHNIIISNNCSYNNWRSTVRNAFKRTTYNRPSQRGSSWLGCIFYKIKWAPYNFFDVYYALNNGTREGRKIWSPLEAIIFNPCCIRESTKVRWDFSCLSGSWIGCMQPQNKNVSFSTTKWSTIDSPKVWWHRNRQPTISGTTAESRWICPCKLLVVLKGASEFEQACLLLDGE